MAFSVSSFAGGLGLAGGFNMFSPLLRPATYAGNAAMPSDLPEAWRILDAFNKGRLSEEHARTWLRLVGVQWTSEPVAPDNSKPRQVWRAVQRAMQDVPDINAAAFALLTGRLDQSLTERVVNRSGVDRGLLIDALPLYRPYPSIEQAQSARIRDRISRPEWENWLKRQGANPDDFERAMHAMQAVITVTEAQVARNRGLISDEEFTANLRSGGFISSDQRQVLNRLREAVPSISDLTRMAVKEAFFADLSAELGSYDEHPGYLDPWMNALGYHGKVGMDIVSDGVKRPAKWLDLYWAAHWDPISPTQAYTMFHRLRPNRMHLYRRYLGVKEGEKSTLHSFSIADVRRWLRIDDYHPNIRDNLAAIAYRPMRVFDIRSIVQIYMQRGGVRDNAVKWANEQYLDRGHNPDDAQLLANLDVDKWIEKRQAPVRRATQESVNRQWKAAQNAYKVGTVTREQFVQVANNMGVDANATQTMASAIDVEVRTKLAQSGIAGIKADYMAGVIDQNRAGQELRLLGLTDIRANQYIRMWRTRRNRERRQASTAQVLDFLQRGLIGAEEADNRLDNLGWKNRDSLLWIGRAQQNVAKMQAAALKASEMERRRAGQELERLQRLQVQQMKALQAQLRLITPITKLQSWIRRGIIGEGYFRRRASAMGYTVPEIDYYLEEAAEQGELPDKREQGGNGSDNENPPPT